MPVEICTLVRRAEVSPPPRTARTRISTGVVALWGALILSSLAALGAGQASAQTGISDDRVKLPEGPGSLEGVGQNAQVDGKMGLLGWAVPIVVPQGFPGATPSLALSYSSGAGQSDVGMGWSLSTSTIERTTVRGLPRYTEDDDFAVDGGADLVRLPSSDGSADPVYRSRREGSLARYTWMNAVQQDQAKDWWKVEYPDGSVAAFGADLSGALDPDARLTGPLGTFRYFLVETRDVDDHSVVYRYEVTPPAALASSTLPKGSVSTPRLQQVAYAFPSKASFDSPRFEVTLLYEDRGDWITDGRPGFLAVADKRLAKIFVRSDGQPIRRHELTYEAAGVSGVFSRLSQVDTFGRDGGHYPVSFQFGYTQALGAACDGAGCSKPYVVALPLPAGVNLANQQSTFLDINGDSLPDLLSTVPGQRHRFYLNRIDADGQQTLTTDVESALPLNQMSSMTLGASVQPLDVNGDGFADLLNLKTGEYLPNLGSGDWEPLTSVASADGLLPSEATEIDIEDAEHGDIRFLDYDSDKRIDILWTDLTTTKVFRNVGGGGFVVDEAVDTIGAAFTGGHLDLADMNGDGLMDVVQIQPNQNRYRLSLGWGHWTDWVTIDELPFDQNETLLVELEDINGDSLSDIVLVQGSVLRYALNINGAAFGPVQTIEATAALNFPTVEAGTSVLFADMNGNGSDDVVWVSAAGVLTYLELFPVRPNLLTRIANGIGTVMTYTYSTTVQQRALDVEEGSAEFTWSSPVPTPMNVVDTVETTDLMTDATDQTSYRYHDGYYDGAEKRYRGFATVVESSVADNTEPGGTRTDYDLGIDDLYREGLVLREASFGAEGRPLGATETTYADCPLAGLPATEDLKFPIRMLCRTRVDTTRQEGAPKDEWVTLSTTWDYDGYANVTRHALLGVTAIGGAACPACDGQNAPCGPTCDGDEATTDATYVTPGPDTGGRWITSKVSSIRETTRPDQADAHEVRTFYDGDSFVGLAAGHLTKGHVTRVSVRSGPGADDFLDTQRNAYDGDGNVVESLDALGEPGGSTHRTTVTFDALGLRPVASDQLLTDARGPYRLRVSTEYDPTFDQEARVSIPTVVRDGQTPPSPPSTRWTFDEFGRKVTSAEPGDPDSAPTTEYTWDLGVNDGTASRIVSRSRAARGAAAPDRESAICKDGRGRTYQTRFRVGPGKVRVTGFTVLNAKGAPIRVHQAYESDTLDCDAAPPADTAWEEYSYDAAGRRTETALADVDHPGGRSRTRIEYHPLAEVYYTAEDLDDASPNKSTPTVRRMDGQGRVVSVERWRTGGAEPLVDRLVYDDHGNLAQHVDASGRVRTQSFDTLEQQIQTTDADRGTTSFEYDALGTQSRHTDAAGNVIVFESDAMQRPTARWDEADKAGTLVTFEYDDPSGCPSDKCTYAAGHLVHASYPLSNGGRGHDWFGYDEGGEQVWQGRELDGHLYEVTSELDGTGSLMRTTYPGGRVVELLRDGAGQVTSIPGVIDAVVRDERGLATRIEYTNGAVTTMAFDAVQLAVSLRTEVGGKLIVSQEATYDRLGRLVATDDTRAEAAGPSSAATYAYDDLGRLVATTLDPARPDWAETLGTTYDTGGRVLAVSSSRADSPAGLGALEYGDPAHPNAVTQAGDVAYVYDAAGRMTQRGEDTLTWDAHGRLVSVTGPGGRGAVYDYGPSTHRVARRVDGSADLFITDDFDVRAGIASIWVSVGPAPSARIEYASLATQILSDVAPADGPDSALVAAPDGVITAADGWLAAAAAGQLLTLAGDTKPSDARALFASSAARLLLEGEPERITWLHNDLRNDTVAATNAAGVVEERSAFYPFGAARASGAPDANRRFVGHEAEPDSGLVYFRTRFLDPHIGRWISPDTFYESFGAANTQNLTDAAEPYTYCGNDPINRLDQDGTEPLVTAAMAAGAVVGSAAAVASELIVTQILNEGRRAAALMYLNRNREGDIRKAAKLLLTVQDHPTHEGAATVGLSAVSGAVGGALTLGVAPVLSAGAYIAAAKVRCLAFNNPDGYKAQAAGVLVATALSAGMNIVQAAAHAGVSLSSAAVAMVTNAMTAVDAVGSAAEAGGGALVEVGSTLVQSHPGEAVDAAIVATGGAAAGASGLYSRHKAAKAARKIRVNAKEALLRKHRNLIITGQRKLK